MDCQHLQHLQELRLHGCTAAAEEYAPLASLPALEKLLLWSCLELPDCLKRLPALRLLAIHHCPLITFNPPESDEEGKLSELKAALLDSSLSTLSTAQLTQLQLADKAAEWPTALTRLRGLQMLSLERRCRSESLPIGPWLRSLRWAVLTAEAAATALPALAAATQLEGLGVWSYASPAQLQPILLDILAWAPQQPALRLVEVEARSIAGRETAQSVHAAIERAQLVAPALQVQFGCSLSKRLLFDEESPSIMMIPY